MQEVSTSIGGARRGAALLITSFLVSLPVVAQGQTVTAMWDPSPSADQVTGYQVCVGTSSLSCNVQLSSVESVEASHTFSPSPGVRHYVAVRAMNSRGAGAYSSEASFSIPALTQPVNQSNPAGVAIAGLNLTVTDPDASTLTFTHTGLPTGLTINSSTGRITGTPSAAGTYNVTVFVTDSLVTVSRSFTWTITNSSADTQAPTIAVTSHTNGQTLNSASITVSGTATDSGRGGNDVSSVTVNGQAATGGTASGSATANWSRALTLSQGSNTVTVQATDNRGNVAAQQITLNYTGAAVTSATLSAGVASPQNTGTAVSFTANAAGGVGPRQYKFLVQQGSGAPQMVRDWSTTATYTWAPTTAAIYTVSVWARSAGVTTDAAQASAQMAYVINPSPVTSVSLISNLLSPQDAGTAITFTAAGTGGVAPRQYKFLVRQGTGTNQVAQNWSATATYTWTPTTAASYTITVWSRSAGVTTDAAQASAQTTYVINTLPIAPVTSATLTANVASPQNTGAAVTFTAAAGGGVGPRQYKFLVQQGGGAPQMVRDWSTTAIYAWTPAMAASYTVSVWARSAGATADVAQASAQMAYVINTPPAAPVTSATLTPSVASPQTTGTYVAFVAGATGGVGPRQFKFFIQHGSGAPQMVRDWSTSTSYGWTPATAGTYIVTVWARSAGVTTDAGQASAQTNYAVNAPAGPLSITSLTSNLGSPQAQGTTITFNAVAAGGAAPYQFKWWVFEGSAWKVAQNWSSNATLAWRPAAAGDYIVAVWVRNNGVTADASQALAQVNYKVTAGAQTAPLSIASLTSNLASPQMVGTTVTFNAAASGGEPPYQFKWWVFDGSAWRVGQDWGTSSVFSWRPAVAGDYIVAVWARNNGVKVNASQALAQVNYKITAAAATTATTPLSISGFTTNLASPQVSGTAITFTAAATGGAAPYQFKWWVFDGVAWRVAQNWSASSTLIWRPTTAGDYMVAVWVRNNGVTVDASQVMAQTFYTITNAATAAPLRVTSLTSNVASPRMVGTTVTFSAAASGGQAPYQFKWWVFNGSTWQIAQDWSTSATFNWRPTVAGDYMVAVWVRNNGVKANTGDVMAQVFYSVTATPPLSITSFTSNLASPQVAGSTVTFSAVAAGGNAPYQYKWWIFDGTAWRVGQKWSTDATFNWRPTQAGTYIVAVWVRNDGVKTDASQGLAQTTYIVN